MSKASSSSWLRKGLIWLGPIVVLLLALLCGFLYWVVATPAGTRWALHTGVYTQQGTIEGVRGSFWEGVRVAHLDLPLPDEMHVQLQQLELQVDWAQLWRQRQLTINTLKIGDLDVRLPEQDEPKEDEPFELVLPELPELPITAAIQELYLGNLDLSIGSEHLASVVKGLDAQLSFTDQLDLQLHEVAVAYDEAHAALQAQLTYDGQQAKAQLAIADAVYADFSGKGQLHAQLQGQQLTAQIKELQLMHDGMQATLQAEASLEELAAPWTSTLKAHLEVDSSRPDAPICAHQYLPKTLHQQKDAQGVTDVAHASKKIITYTTPVTAEMTDGAALPDPEAACAVAVDLDWQGSLEQGQVSLKGDGQGFHLDAEASVQPESAMPVERAFIRAQLPDNSYLNADFDWVPSVMAPERAHVFARVDARDFDLGAWLETFDISVPAVLNVDLDLQAQVDPEAQTLYHASTTLALHEGTIWNALPAQGQLALDVARQAETSEQPWWMDYVLVHADADIDLGANHLSLDGRWAQNPDDNLQLVFEGPELETLWPGLDPIGHTNIDLKFGGDWARHRLELKAEHLLSPAEIEAIEADSQEAQAAATGETTPVSAQRRQRQRLGTGWVRAELDLRGALSMHDGEGLPFDRWAADIEHLQVQHGAFTIQAQNATQLDLSFEKDDRPLSVELGAWTLLTQVEDYSWLTLVHEHSMWRGDQWSTKGHTEPVRFSGRFVDVLMRNLGLKDGQDKKGGIVFTDQHIEPLADIELQLDWDVAFQEALGGRISLRRVAGDIMVPDEPPFPLGLEDASVVINLNPQGAGRTQVDAGVTLRTETMGYLQGQLDTLLYFSPEHGFEIRESDLKTVQLDAQMDDLSWTQLIIGDAMELGGELEAHVEIQMRELDNLSMQGDIQGQNLRVTRLDDGVRLLDGTLEARLDDHRFIIDKLYFPARLRVEPKEWRTATWITEEEDAKDGYIDLSGFWDLEDETGHFEVDLHRYPILQRADRYAMMSGDLTVDAAMPQINIKGQLTADAGWFDLDMLGGIPTVDSDVVVIRAGDEAKDEEDEFDDAPLDMNMDIEIDLGPRFYLTGYGVNSGLVGQLRVMMVGDELTGLGALRTRGGAIEIYGQRLQLRRGTVTFQGDITNPILNIEALRTGLAVEAGVRVAGTAHHPKIDLVSYPEVDELEKLSWLLFGHGPDESGGDVALLISVGTSMLSDGEPFYKRFGIDELSLQSGDIGGAGSILPPTSTASSMESEVSEVEKRFIQASKVFGQGFTIGIRQALADSGTVGRATYRLSRRLTAEVTLGTVSGMALLYRWFSRDD